MRKPTFDEACDMYTAHGFVVEGPRDSKKEWIQEWWQGVVKELTEALLAPSDEKAEAILKNWDLPPGTVSDLREEWWIKCEDEKPQLFNVHED